MPDNHRYLRCHQCEGVLTYDLVTYGDDAGQIEAVCQDMCTSPFLLPESAQAILLGLLSKLTHAAPVACPNCENYQDEGCDWCVPDNYVERMEELTVGQKCLFKRAANGVDKPLAHIAEEFRRLYENSKYDPATIFPSVPVQTGQSSTGTHFTWDKDTSFATTTAKADTYEFFFPASADYSSTDLWTTGNQFKKVKWERKKDR